MITNYEDEDIVGVWDTIYPKKYDPENVRVIIREEINLALRSPDVSQFLVDGTVPASKLRIPSGNTLPLAAADGDLFVYAGSGFSWLLRYHRTQEYWHFVGGPPLLNVVETEESTTSASYTNLATVGPSLTVPIGGDYALELGGRFQHSGTDITVMSYEDAGSAASDAKGVYTNVNGATSRVYHSRVYPNQAFTINNELIAKYKTNSGTATFTHRFMRLTPIRVRRA